MHRVQLSEILSNPLKEYNVDYTPFDPRFYLFINSDFQAAVKQVKDAISDKAEYIHITPVDDNTIELCQVLHCKIETIRFNIVIDEDEK